MRKFIALSVLCSIGCGQSAEAPKPVVDVTPVETRTADQIAAQAELDRIAENDRQEQIARDDRDTAAYVSRLDYEGLTQEQKWVGDYIELQKQALRDVAGGKLTNAEAKEIVDAARVKFESEKQAKLKKYRGY